MTKAADMIAKLVIIIDGVLKPRRLYASATAIKEAATLIAHQERRIEALRKALSCIGTEAERVKGNWTHLKRVIGVNARSALENDHAE